MESSEPALHCGCHPQIIPVTCPALDTTISLYEHKTVSCSTLSGWEEQTVYIKTNIAQETTLESMSDRTFP